MNLQPDRLATVSLDLDDKWTYMKTRGMPGHQNFPTYLEIVVPRTLDFLHQHSLRITYFVVGQDAALERNGALLRGIADAGHEIGNHSFHHEPWLHLYSKTDIEREISTAEHYINRATGQTVRGFRGPGYSMTGTVADILASRGYLYDASSLPTFLGPLARLYYMRTSTLDRQERKQRAKLYGHWSDGLRPLKPYLWATPSGPLLEIPVTTMPALRLPFHLSYLIWMSGYSRSLARAYLCYALRLCRLRGVAPSFLLHPLDFLDVTEAPELAFFPGMSVPLHRKLELADFALRQIHRQFRITTMEENAIAATTAISTPRTGQGVPATPLVPCRAGSCSYVMPVYQAQADLEDTMQSLAASTTPCTVFVVDDGSQPPLEVRDYGPRLQVRLIRLPKNKGIVAALNAGLEAAIEAGFEFIARIDAGDFAAAERLEKQISYLQKHPRCMLVGSDAEVRDEDGSYCFSFRPPRDPAALAKSLHERAWLLHPGVMYRAAVLREIGLYTDRYRAAEDYEMFLRIAAKHEVGVVPEPLLIYVLRDTSISARKARVQALSRLRIQLRYFQPANWMSYYGVLRTAGTIFMPRWMKAAFKMKFLYAQAPMRNPPEETTVEVGVRTPG